MTEAEQVELEQASCVEGVDEEIALLRLRLREVAESSPERIDLQLEAANTIARLIRTNYQISREQKKSLRDGIHKVLSEVAVPLGIGIAIGARK